MCVFVPSIGGSPSVQGETCATLCSASRGLHLLSVRFCPTRTNRGHTGGGKHRGFYAPPSSCGACLHFLSREGFGRPYPSSTPKSKFVYSRSFFSYKSFSTTRYESMETCALYLSDPPKTSGGRVGYKQWPATCHRHKLGTLDGICVSANRRAKSAKPKTSERLKQIRPF